VERLKGVGVSGGLVVGPALVAVQRTRVIRFPVAPALVGRELEALDAARTRSREQLRQIRDRVAQRKGRDLAAIFDAQLLLLDDPLLVGRARAIIGEEHINADWAVQRALEEAVDVFNDLADPYLRERKGDLQDVAGRLHLNMRGAKGGVREALRDLESPCVLVADELAPSVVAQLDWDLIRGFATDAGSRTHHTAILARSLDVPAVVGLGDVSSRVAPGALVLIDGGTGDVVIDPDPALRLEVEARGRLARARRPRPTPAPARTRDGVAVSLQANIERADDVVAALECGAEGVGLFRSEFLLAGAPPDMAGEDEQYEEYRRTVERMAPRTVTIRTFDVDERQLRAAFRTGLRGIRFGLAHPSVLKTQLRALLRAAVHGSVRILFPFVSSVQEVRAARALLDDARAELEVRGERHGGPAVGVMIEVPSAAFTASMLAREADFFTIGTNDLIQYTLAVDRTDERVSDRYEPLHPAVLRLIRQIRRGAIRQNIPVSVCGEMASDPVLLSLLLGCGLTEFSMTPGALPMARRVVEDASVADMARIAARVLTLGAVDEIERYLLDAIPSGLERQNVYDGARA
jgi:phosphotransferase system enzyme I (PtsI)